MELTVIHKVFLNFPLYTNSPLFLVLCSSLIACLLFVLVTNTVKTTRKGKNLPPGNLGLPVIGESLSFLRAFTHHKGTEWIGEKVGKYGPVFKTCILGCPTVILTGPAGNRFLFHNDVKSIVNNQNPAIRKILGERNMQELVGEESKRMRGAALQFLKPEALQKFVGRMDSHIRQHVVDRWEGKESVTVVPLVKEATFIVSCDLLFGLSDKEEVKKMVKDFTDVVNALWCLPLNLPGTLFGLGVKASGLIRNRLKSYCEMRRRELEKGIASPGQDLMSCLLTMRDENNKGLTEEEILDNLIHVMTAGYEPTSTLIANMVRMLALHPDIRENIYKEQMEIAAGKKENETLEWEDILKMKYTWKAAQETLRLFPSVFGAFRKTMVDVEYGGYTIPKGWQLLWVAGEAHMNEEIFREPSKFDPSRFDTAIPPYHFIPFGGGVRMCPGNVYAKVESLVYMHHVVRKYKWSMVHPEEGTIWNPSPTPAMGLPIRLHPITMAN